MGTSVFQANHGSLPSHLQCSGRLSLEPRVGLRHGSEHPGLVERDCIGSARGREAESTAALEVGKIRLHSIGRNDKTKPQKLKNLEVPS